MTFSFPRLCLLIVFVATAIIASGCSTGSSIIVTNSTSPEDVINILRQHNAAVSTFYGVGQITLDTPDISNTAGVTVRVSKNDSLMVEISGPFGISLGTGMVTRRQFQFYNGIDNSLLVGEPTPESFRRVLRIPVEFDDILELFTGTMTVGRAAAPGVIPSGIAKGDEYYIVYKSKKGNIEYVIDLNKAVVSSFRRHDSTGALVEEVRFRDFKERDGAYVPTYITLRRPIEEQELTIAYDVVKVNPPDLTFPFRIPGNVRRISLKASG
ncbi:MAG: DUF4292 domain-containing protein [Chlorobi bacterium]|nr:DUF4292 domain-containing protein [Chlorobiota bacterium]